MVTRFYMYLIYHYTYWKGISQRHLKYTNVIPHLLTLCSLYSVLWIIWREDIGIQGCYSKWRKENLQKIAIMHYKYGQCLASRQNKETFIVCRSPNKYRSLASFQVTSKYTDCLVVCQVSGWEGAGRRRRKGAMSKSGRCIFKIMYVCIYIFPSRGAGSPWVSEHW